MGPDDDGVSDRRLRFQLLLADYQAGREDDRVLAATQAATISVAVALLGLLAAATTQLCVIDNSPNCIALPSPLIAAAPLGPIAVIAFLMTYGTLATVRSYYLRALEEELHQFAPQPMARLKDVLPASYVEFSTSLGSLRRGRFTYRMMIGIIFFAVFAIFGGLTTYIALNVDLATRIAMGIVYIPIASILVYEAIAVTVGGRGLLIQAVHGLLRNRPRFPHVPPMLKAQRSLLSYLIWPRPEDWIKLIFAPTVWAVTAMTVGSFSQWGTFLVVWAVLELLIYFARYQVNDWLGLAGDQDHEERKARARLPIGATARQTKRNIISSIAVAVLRLVAAAVVGWFTGLLWTVVLLVGIVALTALGYEWLRSRPAKRPGALSAVVVAIWITVGVGYSLRAGVGLHYAGVPWTSVTAIAGIAALGAYGIMFVLLTWALEGASLARLVKRADGSQWYGSAGLGAKPHVTALLKYAKVRLIDSPPPPGNVSGTKEPILFPRGLVRAPWNVALVVALLIGTVFALGLAGTAPSLTSLGQLPLPPASYLLVASVVCAALLIIPGSGTQRALFGLVGGGVTIAATIWLTGLAWHPVLWAPWAVIAATYVAFRNSSYHDLKHALRNLGLVLGQAGRSVLRKMVGRRTWDLIERLEREDRRAATSGAETQQTPAPRDPPEGSPVTV